MSKRKIKIKLLTKSALIRLTVWLSLIGILSIWGWSMVIFMPGKSYAGELPPLTTTEQLLKKELLRDIQTIAGEIGEHNYAFPKQLAASELFLARSLSAAGYQVNRQSYRVDRQEFHNLEVEIKGSKKPDEIVVIGAHYDSVVGSPGANDNGTGAAAVLALPFRYPHYHTMQDTPDKVDGDRLARVVAGIERVIHHLVTV